MKKIILLLLVVFLQLSCQENKEKSTELDSNEKTSGTSLDKELNLTLEEQEDFKSQIIALSRKKDSLQRVLTKTKESLSRLNENKIDKGIEGVTKRLNELKGQKESFEEQIALQKKEIELATKKIELLKEEKVVYDDQKNALNDKGATPNEYVRVDSMLTGINKRVLEQTRKVKALKRSVADTEEQVTSIIEERTFLSAKIRENYNAREIFQEYAKDEDVKINALIARIDNEISGLSGKVNSINSQITGLNDDLARKDAEQTKELLEKAESEQTKNRLQIAAVLILILGGVFGALYMIGKKKKEQKNNKNET
jgi:chromosome segregation ATPase